MFNFWKKTETRVTDSEIIADIADGFGLQTDTVTREQALSLPIVSTSINWLSGVVAGLPIQLYKRTKDGYIEVFDDYRLNLVNNFTGNCMTANDFKRMLVQDYLLEGNGYGYVSKKGNRITKLSYIPTYKMTFTESVDCIDKQIRVWIDSREIQEYNILRIVKNSKNGFSGIGFVSDNQLLLSTVLASLEYEKNTIATGVRRGFLKSKFKLDKDKIQDLKTAWRRLTSAKQSDIMVMNEGIDFEDASNTATESQLSQNKEINNKQILAYFGLPDNFLANANSDSYQTAVRIAVLPIVHQLENALNEYLLLESEKQDLKFVINTNDVLRTNVNERFSAYQAGLSSGILTIDEVRRMENMPIIDLPYIKMGLGDVLYNTSNGQIFVPNTGAIVTPNENNQQIQQEND